MASPVGTSLLSTLCELCVSVSSALISDALSFGHTHLNGEDTETQSSQKLPRQLKVN